MPSGVHAFWESVQRINSLVSCKVPPAELSHITTYETASHHWKEKADNIQQGIIKSHNRMSLSPEGNAGRRQSLCSSYCFPHTTVTVWAAALWKHSRLWHYTGFSQWYAVYLGTAPLCFVYCVFLKPCSCVFFKWTHSTMFWLNLDKNKQWFFWIKTQFPHFLLRLRYRLFFTTNTVLQGRALRFHISLGMSKHPFKDHS